MSPRDILNKAADLLAGDEVWSKGAFALTAAGTPVSADNPDAFSFCAIGALMKAAGVGSFDPNVNPDADLAYDTLTETIGGDIDTWNDAPERTQAEVITAFRQAAERVSEHVTA